MVGAASRHRISDVLSDHGDTADAVDVDSVEVADSYCSDFQTVWV